MKKIIVLVLTIVLCLSVLQGCGKNQDTSSDTTDQDEKSASTDLGDDSKSFGASLDALNAYAGYFEDDLADVEITCVSGTEGCSSLSGNVLTFSGLKEDSVYSISGKLKGSIIIDAGDDYKFDLELQGLSLVSDSTNPILISSGKEVSITAKAEYENYVYDTRTAVDASDETKFSAAIYSTVDTEICGKGALTLVSENNNGIHSKDDLQVKNLTLLVACADNALKGNDSVEMTDASTTLITYAGDGIKTTNSDVSDKGNQRGTVTISGGTHTIYAACDGIDAAYDAVIDGEETILNIYTDKYSNFSSEVTAVSENVYYIRFSSDQYKYSVKYYNSDSDFKWVNADYHSTVSGGRLNYYYYSFPKMDEYSKMQFFIYSSDMQQGQDEDYLGCTDYLSPSTGYDTFALTSQGNGISYQWTNYTTSVEEGGFGGGRGGGPGGGGFGGGMGGMSDGNTDKGDHSTKGIKASNEIVVNGGTINVKSYDDALHANNDTALENGENPFGNVTINGGSITAYTNDDGLHADGVLTVTGGSVTVTNSYEGLEGSNVVISGGNVSITANDDGINGTATQDTTIEVSGGSVYINCSGDGIDSNSRTSNKGIVFSGGKVVVISDSQMNSAIDTEQGYSYSGGSVLAIMPAYGMTQEVTNCKNFSSNGSKASMSLNAGEYLNVTSDGKTVFSVQMPISIDALVVYLGSSNAEFSTSDAGSL